MKYREMKAYKTGKPVKGPLIIEGLLKFIIIVLVMCSCLSMSVSLLVAMILAECVQIFRGIYSLYSYHDVRRENIKRFFRYITPAAVSLFVIHIAGTYVSEPVIMNIIDYAAKIDVFVVAFIAIIPLTSVDKCHDRFILTSRELTSVQRNLYKLFGVISRGLIIIGFLLVIFVKPYKDFYYEIIVIIGCVVWYCRVIIHLYCWWNCEIVTDDDEPVSEPQRQDAGGGYADEPISQRDIERIVQKIANRWTGRQDTSLLLSGGGSIRYNVTAEVVGGTFINYTVNGKLSGVREEQLSEAYTLLGGKIDKVAFKISEETKSELAKHKLEYSSYDINVKTGYIG